MCVADEGGILSFKGGLVDISIGGLGFRSTTNITLEPGTVLKGCRIDPYNEAPLVVDLKSIFGCSTWRTERTRNAPAVASSSGPSR